MKISSAILGPKVWAVAVILCGFAISVPFSRHPSGDAPASDLRSGTPLSPLSDPFAASPTAQASPPPPFSHSVEITVSKDPNRLDSSSADSSSLSGSKLASSRIDQAVGGGEPSPSQLPDWAKRPSALDELIEQLSNDHFLKQADRTNQKPTPPTTWTTDKPSFAESGVLEPKRSDRFTPFTEGGATSQFEDKRSQIADLVWPDVSIERELAQSLPVPPNRRAVISASKRLESHLSPNGPSFRTDPMRSGALQTKGAALRSRTVPLEEQYIVQPGNIVQPGMEERPNPMTSPISHYQ